MVKGVAMVTNESIEDGKFVCPHCKGNSFILIGVQKQKGLFKDHELWNCRKCHGTFAKETIDEKRSSENERFNKNAFSYYCRIQFAK